MINYEKLLESVDKHRELIFQAERYIWKNPETGYKEWKTSAYLEAEFEKLGYTLTKAGDIPGFYTISSQPLSKNCPRIKWHIPYPFLRFRLQYLAIFSLSFPALLYS
jgi:hypothetical protein